MFLQKYNLSFITVTADNLIIDFISSTKAELGVDGPKIFTLRRNCSTAAEND